MKAAAFDYVRVTSVANALELLASHGDRAKVLSGGQSLMPAMNLRLITPELLVDIGALSELRGISVEGETLAIGALTRHVDLQRSTEIAKYAPLLVGAIGHVAHPAIRNRGTIGGSLAHADPSSELPACMLALGATMVVRGSQGERRVPAQDFFKGIYETVLAPDELLVSVEIPMVRQGSSHFFEEFARRHGDYAIVGLAAQAAVHNGMFADLRLAFFAVGDRPHLAASAAKLINIAVTPDRLSEAAEALTQELEPQEDQQASSAMRRHLTRVLLTRCVANLLERPELSCGAGE